MIKRGFDTALAIAASLLIALGAPAQASSPARADDAQPSAEIAQLIGSHYPGAQIEIIDVQPHSQSLAPSDSPAARAIALPDHRGGASVTLASGQRLRVRYHAWMQALQASRRVLPGERLTVDAFQSERLDIAQGQGREIRGILYSDSSAAEGSSLERLEARQTIMEGAWLTTSAIQRVYDVRRGDALSVRVVAGEVNLNTQAIAQESAYFDSRIRILTQKTKREFIGTLLRDGSVEVRL